MKNVLIVDDEKAVLRGFEARFAKRQNSFKVLFAENGKEAVDIIESTPIDLLVTDLQMPEMGGFELLTYLKTKHPSIPFIVITAHNSSKIAQKLADLNILHLMEKPVRFEELNKIIMNQLEPQKMPVTNKDPLLTDFLQGIAAKKETCLLEIFTKEEEQGYFYFNAGELFDAIFQELKGEDAVYQMLNLAEVRLRQKKIAHENVKIRKRIQHELMALLLSDSKCTVRLLEQQKPQTDTTAGRNGKDDKESAAANKVDIMPLEDHETIDIEKQQIQKGEINMAEINKILEKFNVVEGLLAVGVFSPNGEMVAEFNMGKIKLAEIGALANDVLLKAQKASEIMEVGRGQLVHVEAPKAHIIVRCLNEAIDFAKTAEGKAHLHVVVIIKADGNLGMAKMKLASITQELAPFFR